MTLPEPTPTPAEIAQRLGLLAHLQKRITTTGDRLRAQFLAQTDEGDKKSPKIDGVSKPIAAVSHTQGTPASEQWIVSDRGALLAWTRANYPEHVVTPDPVQPPDHVRPEFEETLLEMAEAFGETVHPDGDLAAIPGIVLKRTPATPGVVQVRADLKVAEQLWAVVAQSPGTAFAALTAAPQNEETQQ